MREQPAHTRLSGKRAAIPSSSIVGRLMLNGCLEGNEPVVNRLRLEKAATFSRMAARWKQNKPFASRFFVLLGGLVLMRVYFALRLRQVGERFMPDQQAIEREGRGMFIGRVIAFFVLLALLALYAIGSPWMNAFSIPLLSESRWIGFALGLASPAPFIWTQAAPGKE